MKVTSKHIEEVLLSCWGEGLTITETADAVENLFYEHKSVCRLPPGALIRLLFNDNQTLLKLLQRAEVDVKDREADIDILTDRNHKLTVKARDLEAKLNAAEERSRRADNRSNNHKTDSQYAQANQNLQKKVQELEAIIKELKSGRSVNLQQMTESIRKLRAENHSLREEQKHKERINLAYRYIAENGLFADYNMFEAKHMAQ